MNRLSPGTSTRDASWKPTSACPECEEVFGCCWRGCRFGKAIRSGMQTNLPAFAATRLRRGILRMANARGLPSRSSPSSARLRRDAAPARHPSHGQRSRFTESKLAEFCPLSPLRGSGAASFAWSTLGGLPSRNSFSDRDWPAFAATRLRRGILRAADARWFTEPKLAEGETLPRTGPTVGGS